jgi:RimJ/RimL family protein N-acetyltransferase
VPTEAGLDAAVPSIRTERLELASMSVPFMAALEARDLPAAERAIGAAVPAWLPGQLDHFLQLRLAQLADDPASRPWLGRAMILTEGEGRRRVVGTVGFHGPPDELGRLEVGYSVDPDHRRRGFAREAVAAMFDWAASTHGIHRFIASISPTNEASLGLAAGFGFEQTGSHVDEIDGLELVFEVDWPRAHGRNVGAGRR